MQGTLLGLVGLLGCGDGVPPEELGGAYEVTERLEGTCDGSLEPGTPSPGERYFQLEYTEEPSERLEYFTCSGPSDCSSTADQSRSFGPAGRAWRGSLATSSTGCVLRYRQRELFPTDEGVEIIQTVYQETDDSLVGDECNDFVARDRGRRMPCVSIVETRARSL